MKMQVYKLERRDHNKRQCDNVLAVCRGAGVAI